MHKQPLGQGLKCRSKISTSFAGLCARPILCLAKLSLSHEKENSELYRSHHPEYSCCKIFVICSLLQLLETVAHTHCFYHLLCFLPLALPSIHMLTANKWASTQCFELFRGLVSAHNTSTAFQQKNPGKESFRHNSLFHGSLQLSMAPRRAFIEEVPFTEPICCCTLQILFLPPSPKRVKHQFQLTVAYMSPISI